MVDSKDVPNAEEKRLSNILFLSMKAKDSIDYVGPGRFDLFLF